MTYPLVLDLAADGVPVAVACRVPGFSRQACQAWKKSPVCQRDWDDAHLINAVLDIHHDDPAFGYRLVAGELPARGITAGENRVARLCSRQQIWSVSAKRRGLARKAGPPVHDDLVQRDFTAGRGMTGCSCAVTLAAGAGSSSSTAWPDFGGAGSILGRDQRIG